MDIDVKTIKKVNSNLDFNKIELYFNMLKKTKQIKVIKKYMYYQLNEFDSEIILGDYKILFNNRIKDLIFKYKILNFVVYEYNID